MLICALIRMDISRMDLTITGESIQFRWIIIFMIYAATVTISLCCSTTDQRLLYSTVITSSQNSTEVSEQMVRFELLLVLLILTLYLFFFSQQQSNNNILNVWNSLSIARSFGALIGWICIGISPNTDKLYAYLLEMEKYDTN